MQIHELTQKRSPVNEGVWDSLRAALSSDPRLDGMTLDQKEAYLKQSGLIQNVANKAAATWALYSKQLEDSIRDPAQLEQFKQRRNKTYENTLRAFVQQNLLQNMPMDQLNNRSQIDSLIKTMSLPGNSSPSVQAPLWQQMAQLTSTAQIEMASPVDASAKVINVNKAAQGIQKNLAGATATTMDNIGQYLSTTRKDAWQLMTKAERSQTIASVARALTANGITVSGYSPAGTPGSAATALSRLAATNATIKSTGNASLDAVLTTLGFNVI
jgi:hypothetical protein